MKPKQTLPSGRYVPQLDGLRGVAIVLVLSYHFFPAFSVSKIGWSGLDLFFVLSGYLLTGRLLPYINQKKIIYKFYQNRFLRIVPLYFGFLLLFFAGWFFLSSAATISNNPFYSRHWWQFLLFFQNWVYIFDGPKSIDYLNHFWSLAVEEQYYIFFPFSILALGTAKYLLRFSLVLIILVVISRYYFYLNFTNGDYLKVYWNSFFRLDSFFIGILLYSVVAIYKEKLRKYFRNFFFLTLVIFIAGVCFSGGFDKNDDFIVILGHTLISILFAYIIYLVVIHKKGIVYTCLSSRFLVFTGRISFGMYIIHWPLFLLGFKYISSGYTALHIPADPSLIHYTNVFIAIILSYIFGYLSFTYYESFFMKFKSRYK